MVVAGSFSFLYFSTIFDDDLIKGESPTSNLGVYAKYVQALVNYTHWLQLGFNIAGMPFNAFAGFAQSVREIGFRNTLRGLRRVIGSLTVGGGGGGSGRAGGAAGGGDTHSGGAGGAGTSNSISGSAVTYAGGGGGGNGDGAGTAGAGAGGGGNGGQYQAAGQNGTANRGGGGGGGSGEPGNGNGGAGGSGVVIVAYTTGSITATGGTITTSGGNTIHTFTSSGTFQVTAIGGGATFDPMLVCAM